MEYKHIREFIAAVFPDAKVPAKPVLPEDVVPLYLLWCFENGKEA